MEQSTENLTPKQRSVTFLKNLYFYLVSFVALMMVVFSLADLINVVLRTFVFTKADKYPSYPVYQCDPSNVDPNLKRPTPEECQKMAAVQEKQQDESRMADRQRSLVRDISMIIVGVPLFLYHWMIVRRKEDKA